MNPNLNFENDVWLDRLVPSNKPSRRCGHCHKTGHTLWDCVDVKKISDMLNLQAVDHILTEPLGYKFETFVYGLTTPYLKILYKRICEKTMKKKEMSVYEEIFDKYKEKNLGYEGPMKRRIRIYSDGFRAATTDVTNRGHGRILQTYLLNLQPLELAELIGRIGCREGAVWIGRLTSNTQRRDMEQLIQFTDMTTDHYYIHCHFSEINIGYRFLMYPFYIFTSRQKTHLHPLTILQDGMSLKMTNNQSNFSKSVDLELLSTTVKDLTTTDCAICMDSKSVCQNVMFNCSHEFCGDCVGKHIGSAMKSGRDVVCPMCRASVTKIVYKSVEILGEMKNTIVA